MRTVDIEERFADATLNLALDTIAKRKQALVFCNTKRGAESQAERIAEKIKDPRDAEALAALADRALSVVSSPTRQCKRLATCLRKGAAFHHAGLHAQQRELVETAFRNGTISIICATPTLCLAPGTMVWSGMADVPVERLGSSHVLALSGSRLVPQRADRVERLLNSEELLVITSVAGHTVRVTPGHRILVKRQGKRLLVRADGVRRSDRLATVGHLPASRICSPKIGEFLFENTSRFSDTKIDTDLAYLLGVILGDGYSGASISGEHVVYKGTPCVVGRDEEIFAAVQESCKRIGISVRRSFNASGVPQLILGKNQWFREFLVRCGVEQRDRKHIDQKLLCLPDDSVAALLRGLFDTDGCAEKGGKRVSFSNTSIILVRQMQRCLLRFGIVTYLRTKPSGKIRVHQKEYATKNAFELHIAQKEGLLRFAEHIGFGVHRKQERLRAVVRQIRKNLHFVECSSCEYRIHRDLFCGRSTAHRKWAVQKLGVIATLGRRGELGSRDIKRALGYEPKKKDARLNHHYPLIRKRRLGSRSKTEWFWSLNAIGSWLWKELLSQGRSLTEFFDMSSCPLCGGDLLRRLKRGWRSKDVDGDIFWDAIHSVQPSGVAEEVYDVALPTNGAHDHLFVANGILVHNSMGMDLPAFRTIIRDLKRYSQGTSWGMSDIPVLEYEQMSGRAGRPGKEEYGEAICIAQTESDEDRITEKYLRGDPEDIYSKLAVEPVLRTYVLSLIASGYVRTEDQLRRFFNETLYARQYGDTGKLNAILARMVHLLAGWGFLDAPSCATGEFVVASEVADGALRATTLGERVAQLYIDPLTAHDLLAALADGGRRGVPPAPFALLHLIATTLELRPLFAIRQAEFEAIDSTLTACEDSLYVRSPSAYGGEYEEYLQAIKTAVVLRDWIEEVGEDHLLERHAVAPGDLHAKIERADWILHSLVELCKLRGLHGLIGDLEKLRVRLEHGAKEDLLPLLRLRGVGRVRGRALCRNGIRTLDDVRKADLSRLRALVGNALAVDIKEQVGVRVEDAQPKRRKGQIALGDYDGKSAEGL